MKRITELEKSRILEMYQSIPMKPWLFEQKSDFAVDRASAAVLSKSPEDYKQRTAMIDDAKKQLFNSSMEPKTLKEFVENSRTFLNTNWLAIGAQVGLSWHPYGKIAVSALWGLFLIYDVKELLNGNPDYFNILGDILGIAGPHLFSAYSKLQGLKGTKNLGNFVKKLGETELLPQIVNLFKKLSGGLRYMLVKSLQEAEVWLKFLTYGWAVNLLKWIFSNVMRILTWVDDFVSNLLLKSGIGTPIAYGVGAAVGTKAIEKVMNGIRYVWDEVNEMWLPMAEITASEQPRIPREFENLDDKFYWTYDDKNKLDFFSKSNADYKWSVRYNSGDFQQNYNQGKPWEKGKGGWDATTGVYFHKNAKINPSQWTEKK
jgi:hypothetical protein